MRTVIELTRDWSGHKSGTRLDRLHPGFALTLVNRGIARLIEGPPPKPVRASTSHARSVSKEQAKPKPTEQQATDDERKQTADDQAKSNGGTNGATAKRGGRKKATRNRGQ